MIVIAAIIVSETIGMMILGVFNHEISIFDEAVEIIALTLLISTIVYFTLILPLTSEIIFRRTIEDELRDQYNRLEQVTAAIGAGLVVIDKDYHLIWCNRIMQQSFDCHPGTPCHLTFKQHERPCDKCGVKELFASGSDIITTEHMLTDVRGTNSWYQVIVTPIREQDGTIRSALELLIPIGDRKLIEETLLQSEARFRSLVENSSDWVWEVDANGRYSYAGPQCRKLLGYEPEDLIGTSPFQLMVQPEAERVAAIFREIVTRREQFTLLENTVRRKDGRSVVMETSGSPYFDSNGLFMGYRGIDRDISVRKKLEKLKLNYQQELEQQVKEQTTQLQLVLKEKEQLLLEELEAEMALRASEIRFRQIFDSSDDGIIIFDRMTGQALDINPAALDIFRFASRTSEQLSWADFGICAETGSRIDFDQICLNDRFSLSIVTSTCPDGSPITLKVWGKLLNIDSREAVYFSLHDISEKVRVEKESRLIQTKLIQTNKMTSLGLLIAGIAHEINNPNNSILLGSELLSRTWEDVCPLLESRFRSEGEYILGGRSYSEVRESVPRLLAMMTDSSRRIEGIINNLREFVIQGNAGINQQVDINRIVSVSASILQNHIKKHTQHFSLNLQETLPQVTGNPQQLEQVVVNLIMNAIQSLPSQDRGVQVSTGRDQDGGHVTITVRDEGCGIHPEFLSHVFEPFSSTKLDSGGTGLGLAISDQIIKEHHGRIEIDSTVGSGTNITVILPVTTSVSTEKWA